MKVFFLGVSLSVFRTRLSRKEILLPLRLRTRKSPCSLANSKYFFWGPARKFCDGSPGNLSLVRLYVWGYVWRKRGGWGQMKTPSYAGG